MTISVLSGLLGGLGLFIYGMTQMGEGLQKAAGDRMRRILEVLTARTWMGVTVGAVVTAVVQSSSATTVMLVSFVNAGLMTLRQAVGVVMGANIGTTVTAQLIAFDLSDLALPAVGLGFVITFFSRRKIHKYLGQIVLGFGLLFLGMTVMTDTMRPLRDNPAFVRWMANLGEKPILGVLAGLAMTMIIQSSSATIGLLMAAASQGIVGFDAAVPVLFGDNIGTCITAVLASVGANLSARRTAVVHVLFNVFGTILFLGLLQLFKTFVYMVTPSSDIARLIANAHTSFNVLNTLVWLPMAGVLARIATALCPGKEFILERGPKYLDKRMLSTPSVALQLAVRELVRMAGIAREMVKDAGEALLTGRPSAVAKSINAREDLVDNLQAEIILYLSTVMAQGVMTQPQSTRLAGMLHVVNDIERIGDHAVNISEFAIDKVEQGLEFSDEAKAELRDLFERVDEVISDAVQALEKNDPALAQDVWEKEKYIDELEDVLRTSHLRRLNQGRCSPASGVIYVEVVDNLERMADHAVNLADAVVQNAVPSQD
ncbi:MAG: Na/Pi cotransporter family protein [Firmicutes bacterium]|nr:Na/Pi cotransporter family protein [Bacillota bacterium]MDH7495651.1 Na/Pi cotransporter family protein [Bacillota bacterium]